MAREHHPPSNDVEATRRSLEAVAGNDAVPRPLRTTAHYVLWEICQLCGDPAAARRHLDIAARHDPLHTRLVAGATPARSILRLAAPGDFQANIPLDFLLDGATLLHTFWIADPERVIADPASAFPAGPPVVDCVFIGIAQDPRHTAHLRAADMLAQWLGRPVVNNGARIGRLSRDGAARLLDPIPELHLPAPVAATPGRLMDDPPPFPFLLRPLTSHAGQALVLVRDAAGLFAALAASPDTRKFFATPFIDFASPDGLYRKYRVVFVDGRPYPVHLAIHDDWAVWYYNAGMERDAARRDEEARFLADMPAALGPTAMRALGAIAQRVGLDYFGIDCALSGDGRLILFEVETGMIVHDRDPEHLFPYKKAAMRRISAAFERMVDRRRAFCRAPAASS